MDYNIKYLPRIIVLVVFCVFFLRPSIIIAKEKVTIYEFLRKAGKIEPVLPDSLVYEIGFVTGTFSYVHQNDALSTTVLNESAMSSIDDYFNIKGANESSRAVLNLFFGIADAAIVEMVTFETLNELKPQMGNDLFILKHSPPYIGSILCIR